jgi:exonuclease VII large subunit
MMDTPTDAVEILRATQREVYARLLDRYTQIEREIDEEIEPELARLRYEQAITQRLLDKTTDAAQKDDWRIHLDVLQMLIIQQEDRLAECEKDLHHYDQLLDEIHNDLGDEIFAAISPGDQEV